VLKNGKHRDLFEVKPTQFTTVRKLFVKNGIINKVKGYKIFLPFLINRFGLLRSQLRNTKFVSNDCSNTMKPTITIIGAGISGLSAGLHLHRKGFTAKL
jgi:hypothetical protein